VSRAAAQWPLSVGGRVAVEVAFLSVMRWMTAGKPEQLDRLEKERRARNDAGRSPLTRSRLSYLSHSRATRFTLEWASKAGERSTREA